MPFAENSSIQTTGTMQGTIGDHKYRLHSSDHQKVLIQECKLKNDAKEKADQNRIRSSASDTSDDNVSLNLDERRMSTAGLLIIAFFWVCGGIYGNETLLKAAPPGIVFLLLLICPFVYALPISIINGELAAALPYDGGLVTWVEEACGKVIGLQNMYWLWVSYVFDAAAYPALAAQYIGKRVDLKVFDGNEQNGEAIVSMIIIGFVTLIKLAGTDWLVRASGAFFVLSILPTMIYMLYGAKELKWDNLTVTAEGDQGLDISLLISWVLWLYAGFLSLGSLAGEVMTPSKTYPKVIALLIPVVTTFIVWPLAVSLSLDQDRANYDAGHFGQLATSLCGNWLGIMFVLGAFFSFIGLYNAQVVVCERSLAASLSQNVDDYFFSGAPPSCLVGYLFAANGTGVAPVYILFNAVVSSALVWLPYESLIEFSMLQFALCSLFFIYAYLWYKVKRPDMYRPLSVPGGLGGAIVVSFPIVAIALVNIYFGCMDDEAVFGVPYAKAVGLAFITGAGCVIHGTYFLIFYCIYGRWPTLMLKDFDQLSEVGSLLSRTESSPSKHFDYGTPTKNERTPLLAGRDPKVTMDL
eukprot:m.180609 g.180609  ORF g.180609 m.180609 type:complete len:581 (-) comp18426_c0_seq1:220-1962(-)